MKRAFVSRVYRQRIVLNPLKYSVIILSNKHEAGGKIREAMPKCHPVSPASCTTVYREMGTVRRVYVNRNNIIHCSCGGSGTKVRGKRETGRERKREKVREKREREIGEPMYICTCMYAYAHNEAVHVYTLLARAYT